MNSVEGKESISQQFISFFCFIVIVDGHHPERKRVEEIVFVCLCFFSIRSTLMTAATVEEAARNNL
jgi:hypothetical protein